MRRYYLDCYDTKGKETLEVDTRQAIKDRVMSLLDDYNVIIARECNHTLALYANTSTYGKLKCTKLIGDWTMKNMHELIDKVISEQRQLEDRLNSLTMFIADRANFNNLYDDMRFLLYLQRDIMYSYNEVLKRRIKLMSDYIDD